jgi:hypothetical protein
MPEPDRRTWAVSIVTSLVASLVKQSFCSHNISIVTASTLESSPAHNSNLLSNERRPLLIQIQFRENRADDWRVERVAIEGKWIVAF